MNPPILTFFNNKGGVGKTSLVYHLAWAFSLLQKKVVVVDIDPQANLTASFLTEDEIDELWNPSSPKEITETTIYQCVKPITGVSDIIKPRLRKISSDLFLVPGDVRLSGFEETLSDVWPSSLGSNNLYRPLRTLSSFWYVMTSAAEEVDADIVLVDIGPNLGAINRSVLIAADFVAIPLGADLFSLQGLKNLGPTLADWRKDWSKRLGNWRDSKDISDYQNFQLPNGKMEPIGYLCQQYGVRLDRPVQAYDKWVKRIPNEYRRSILNKNNTNTKKTPEDDPHCLATIKHYRSLIPMAQEHRKPIFQLTVADGAIGAHSTAVHEAEKEFTKLAKKIASKIGIDCC